MDQVNSRPSYIVWLDHMEPSGDNVWWGPDEWGKVNGPAVIETVGYIIRDEADWLLVAGQVTEDGYTSQPLLIVKSCIIKQQIIHTEESCSRKQSRRS